MKKGFTLAEVLITLVIIGVIASMTIPTLMNSTNSQEFKVGLKKAISALNQAMSLNYALENTKVGSSSDLQSASDVVTNLFQKRMSVISTATNGTAFATDTTSHVTPTSGQLFYTADGMRYAIAVSSTGTYDPTADEMYYGYVMIDVNGDKGPNTMCTDANTPTDTYIATLYGNRVVAGDPASTTGASAAAQQVIFDKKTTNNTTSNTGS
jgi:prepilin-type N-terminal cleavage/methylation domain-containing protein